MADSAVLLYITASELGPTALHKASISTAEKIKRDRDREKERVEGESVYILYMHVEKQLEVQRSGLCQMPSELRVSLHHLVNGIIAFYLLVCTSQKKTFHMESKDNISSYKTKWQLL